MKIKSVNELNEEFSDFPFIKVCKFATIYSKTEKENWEFIPIDLDEMSDEECVRIKIPKGTRIGKIDDNWNMTQDNKYANITEIVIFTEDSFYWEIDTGENSYKTIFEDEDTLTFEVDENIGYIIAQEGVDIIKNRYENQGGVKIGKKKDMKKLIELYKLDHLLIGN